MSAHSTVGGSPFPQIAEYGFISDGEVTALLAPSGSVEWMCLPRMDSPSVFGAILGREAGMFRLGPADVTVPAGRRYLPGTMVLETTWNTPTGWAVVRDALLIGPWGHETRRSATHRARARRSRRREGAPANRSVSQRHDRLCPGMRAGVQLRERAGDLASHRCRLRTCRDQPQRLNPSIASHDGPQYRFRGTESHGQDQVAVRRPSVLRTVVGRWRPPGELHRRPPRAGTNR